MPARSITKRPPDKIAEAEKTLIRFAIESEESFNLIKENLSDEEFTNPGYREIFKKLETVPGLKILSKLDSEDQKRLVREALIDENFPSDAAQITKDCINVIKGYNIKKQIEKLRQDIMAEEKSGNLEAVKKLNSEYRSLSEILRTTNR
jgi:replicative DNA helicase